MFLECFSVKADLSQPQTTQCVDSHTGGIMLSTKPKSPLDIIDLQTPKILHAHFGLERWMILAGVNIEK